MDNDQPKLAFRAVLERLLEKSKKDEVRWQEQGPSGQQWYLVKFPESGILLRFISPDTEPDYYVAYLHNAHGQTVQTFAANESDPEGWNLLRSLWNEAYRVSSGWDKALADVDKAIRSVGKVGDDFPF